MRRFIVEVAERPAEDRAWPDVGKTSCISSLSVVVLPAPFGPRKPNTSPGSTARDRQSSARYGRGRQKPTCSPWTARGSRLHAWSERRTDLRRVPSAYRRQLDGLEHRRAPTFGCAAVACFSSCAMATSMIPAAAPRHLDAVDEEGRRRVHAEEAAERGVDLHVGQHPRILRVEVGDAADVPHRLLQPVEGQGRLVGEDPVLERSALPFLRAMRTAAAASQAIGCTVCGDVGVALGLEREVLGHELDLARRLLLPLRLERLVHLEGLPHGGHW